MSARNVRAGRRATGTDQRARGTSPRATGTNPRALGENPNPEKAESDRRRRLRIEAKRRQREQRFLACSLCGDGTADDCPRCGGRAWETVVCDSCGGTGWVYDEATREAARCRCGGER